MKPLNIKNIHLKAQVAFFLGLGFVLVFAFGLQVDKIRVGNRNKDEKFGTLKSENV